MSRRQGGDFGRKVYHKLRLLWFIRIYRPFRSRELFPSIEVIDVLIHVEHLLLLKRCARLEAETIGDDGRFDCVSHRLIGNHCGRCVQIKTRGMPYFQLSRAVRLPRRCPFSFFETTFSYRE